MASIPETLNIALQHHRVGRLLEAEALYRQILEVQPDHPDALHLLGLIAHQAGRHVIAAQYMSRAIMLDPDQAEVHNNIGQVYCSLGKLQEAIAHYRRALALQPVFCEAHYNMGNALAELGRLQDAVASYRQALALKPDHAETFHNLGIVLRKQGLLEEAVTCYRRALTLKPGFAHRQCSLAIALSEQGKHQEAEENFRLALAASPDDARLHSVALFDLTSRSDDTETIAQTYKAWNDRHVRPWAAQIKPHGNDRNTDRRLRVGYVSADFWKHATSYFVEPLLSAHDRATVEVVCYSNSARSDDATQRMQDSAVAWRSIVGVKDEDVVEMIRADGIDILVDLSGHTAGNRLLVFARKPAPVQVTYLGSLTTSGLSTMDYKLTDRFLSPPGASEWFAEELIHLPGCFVCYQSPDDAPSVAPLSCVSTGFTTFGSFNNLRKVTPEVAALWARILKMLPRAKLVLKDRTLADPAQRARYLDLFLGYGITAERLELLPRTSMADYLAQYRRVDIALDPFPYNGCTTTCEALWMGVPVISLAGMMSYGRFGVSLLSNVGLQECIAATPEEYVSKAVELADNRACLAEIRSGLRQRMAGSTLCDAKAFADGTEHAYRTIWRRWCQKPT